MQSKTDASQKRPLKSGLTHHEKTEGSFYACFGAKRFFFSNSRKIFPMKEMRSIALIKSPCPNLATKINAFQSASEVKV